MEIREMYGGWEVRVKSLIFNTHFQRICINNCQYTLSQILPKIQKAFQDIRELSLESPISEAFKCYHVLDGKVSFITPLNS